MEWIKCTLGDILNFRRGYDLPHSEMKGGSVPVAGSNGIIGYHDVATDISPVITIGRSGNVGTPYIYTTAWAHNTTLYIDDFKGNDPLYLYYLIRTLPLSSFGGGSAVPTLNRNHIHPLEIKHCPDVKEQRRIAAFFKSFDDKINLNNRINHNLEEQAQALYKSWFVDFEPFKDGQFAESELGLIPADWNVKRIGELPLFIADYVANGSFASLKENVKLYESENYAVFIRNTDLKAGSFPVFVDAHSYNFLSKTKLSGGEIIISNVGDVGSVHFCPVLNRPMTLGNNVIMIKAEERQYNVFLYLCLKYFSGHYSIDGITGGSAMPKFNKTDFKGIKIIIPSPQILSRFDEIASPLYERIEKNKRESEKLSIERDTLLPALMSGQLTC